MNLAEARSRADAGNPLERLPIRRDLRLYAAESCRAVADEVVELVLEEYDRSR